MFKVILGEILAFLEHLFKFLTFPLLNIGSHLYVKEHFVNLSNTSSKDVASPAINRRLKCVHLSDFHFDYFADPEEGYKGLYEQFTKWWRWLRRNVRYHRISKQQLKEILIELDHIRNIDIIILTGDFFEDLDRKDIDYFIDQFLSKLKKYASLGVVGVLGNHDERCSSFKDREVLVGKLNRVITMLDISTEANNHQFCVTFTKSTKEGSFDIELYGFLDFYNVHFWENYHKIVKHLNEHPVKENTLRFLLSHNPDTVAWLKDDVFHVDVICSGHTHGGQVVIPIFSFLINIILVLFWRFTKIDLSYEQFLYAHFSFEQVDQMKQGCFTYIPLIPIIIYLYQKATLWTFVRKRISNLKLVRRLLSVCKHWEWGTGLFELKMQDDSTLIDRVLQHHHKNNEDEMTIGYNELHHDDIRLIYRKYKLDRRQFCHTTAGLGTHYPLRLFCPPEIAVLNFTF